MFSRQAIACPHEGQRERGFDNVIGSARGSRGRLGRVETEHISALSIFQPRSSICGRRWMDDVEETADAEPEQGQSGRRKQPQLETRLHRGQPAPSRSQAGWAPPAG